MVINMKPGTLVKLKEHKISGIRFSKYARSIDSEDWYLQIPYFPFDPPVMFVKAFDEEKTESHVLVFLHQGTLVRLAITKIAELNEVFWNHFEKAEHVYETQH